MSIFSKIFNRSAAPQPLATPPTSLGFGRLGMNSGDMSLSSVYRAVSLISSSVAMLPIKVSDASGACSADDLKLHPIHAFFEMPNLRTHIDRFQLMRLLIQDVLLKGNGFAKINREGGKFYSLRYLSDVTIQYNNATDKLIYKSNSLGVLSPEDVVHLRLHTTDGINGISVRNWARRSFSLANSAEDLAANSFESGCNLAGILKVQGPLSAQQRQDILGGWAGAFTQGGSGLAVIPGNMDYQAVQQSSAASQLLETRSFSVSDIARFFGINPVLLGDNSASSNLSLESLYSQFVTLTLQPYIRMIESEFSRKLLDDKEYSFSINLDENYLLKADKNVQASYFGTLLQNGVLCINEVRKEMGLGEVDGLDKHIVAYTDINQNTLNKEEGE